MKKHVSQGELHHYQRLPKSFVGPQQADELFMMFEKLARNTRSWAYLFTAASAAAESGIRASHQSAEVRHLRVDQADDTWEAAQQRFLKIHAKDGWSDSKLLTIPHRIEMHRICTALYHDLIDGNIRTATMQATHERLVRLATQNYNYYHDALLDNDTSHRSRLGLGSELGTILAISRLHWPSLIAIPGTARADNGGVLPEQTHDINLIRQSWGKIEDWIPYEVKSSARGETSGYLSAIIAAGDDLRVSGSSDPLEHAVYMRHEIEGSLSKESLLKLDRATSNVLAKALEYKSRDASQQLPTNIGSAALTNVKVA